MSTTTTLPLPRPTELEFVDGVSLRRFTIDEYHEMIDRGLFAEDDGYELLDGYLVKKMPRNPPHDSTIQKLVRRFLRLAPTEYQVRVQLGITLSDTEPEPDLVVAFGNETNFDHDHPWPAVIALIVEVADSTLDSDINRKAPLYADAGVPIYWVVNIPDRQIEAYSQPIAGNYGQREVYVAGSRVPLVVAGTQCGTIAVDDVLPTSV